MSFRWPIMLLGLFAVPALLMVYRAALERRRARLADLAARGFTPTSRAARDRWLQHLPFACSLAAVALLAVAMARPEISTSLPHRRGTVVLAFDVSNSMAAKDLEPTRIDAAKTAARTFVEAQPSSIEIGVVAFSDGALVTQAPTSSHADVLAAVERLKPSGGTSLGQGMFAALGAIAGKPLQLPEPSSASPGDLGASLDNMDIGYYGSAAVVLLSDGENRSSIDPVEVAKLASVAGVKVYPIAIGSAEGTVLQIDGFSVATAVDTETLTSIAETTNGKFFSADDSAGLVDIYKSIDLEFTTESERTEVTAIATAIATAMLVIGGAMSLLIFGRVV
jgi:Ca-activated chloride channel family protein